MTPSELYQLINRHFSNGKLNVPASAFGEIKVGEYIAGNCINSILVLDQATEPVATENGVIIEKSTPVGIKTLSLPCSASSNWWIDENQTVQMQIQLTAIDQTKVDLKTLYKGLESSFNHDYAFSSIGFEINTSRPQVDFNEEQMKYAPGLYHPDANFTVHGPLEFKARFEWPDTLSVIRDIFIDESAEMSGQLQIVNSVPQYRLIQPGKELTIGHLNVQSEFHIAGLLLDSDSEIEPGTVPDPDAMHALRTTFQLKNELDEAQDIVLSTQWQVSHGETIEIRASKIEKIAGEIQHLVKTLTGSDIQLPEIDGLPILETFHLQKMQLGLDVASLKPKYFGAEFTFLESDRPFEIIQDVISLTQIKIAPFAHFDDNGKPSFMLDLGGKIALTDSIIVDGGFEANISLPSLNFSIGLEEYATLDADKLLRKLIPVLPAELQLKVSELQLTGSIREKSFAFAGRLAEGTSIDFGLFKLEELGVYFNVNQGKTQESSVSLEGVLSIQEELGVQVRGEISTDGWEFQGSLRAYEPINLGQLLPQDLQLPEEIAQVKFEEIDLKISLKKKKEIHFALKGKLKLAIPEMGEIEVNQLALSYEVEGDEYSWKIESKGAVRMIPKAVDNPEWLVDCGGTLTISGTHTSFGINFKSDGCMIREIPLLIPYKVGSGSVEEWSHFSFNLDEISLKKKESWEFTTLFKLKLTRAPKQLMTILGDEGVSVKLLVNSEGAEIGLNGPVFDLITHDLYLPAMGEVPAFNLGKARFQVSSLSINIGKAVGLKCTTKLWLPERTNHLFGTDSESGVPKLDLFDVYQPNVETPSLDFEFSAGINGSSPAIGLKMSSFPIKSLQKVGDDYLLNLGPLDNEGYGKYGSLSFKTPTIDLNLSKGGIELTGGFELKRDFAIPLDLLKTMLKASSVPDWADKLPDAIPVPYLDRPKFFKDNKLNIEEFKSFYHKLFNESMPDGFVSVLEDISKVADKIPEKLKRYLELPDLSGLEFNCTIRPDGGVNVLLEPKGEIRLLGINPPLSLQGITLRSFSFGTLFAGQLFTTHIDADFEQFDIVQLGLALLAPESAYPIIGNPNNYGTKLELHKLSILIFYQTGYPIPIPLFYDRLGIDYYGIGGFAFKGGVEFPQPSLDLKEIGSLLNNLTKFISDEKYQLPTSPPPENFDLSFKIAPTFLTLPPFLGGEQFGLKEELAPPTLYQTFAFLANTVKFASLEYALDVIPLEYRFKTGADRIAFNFLSMRFEAEWLLTTPKEFYDKTRKKLNLDPEAAMKLLEIVPGPNDQIIKPDDEGLLAFVRGNWKTHYSELEVVAGLIAVSVNQFRIGFKFKGSIKGIFDVDIVAFARMQKVAPHFLLYGEGKTKFKIAGQNIFEGETSLDVSETDFKASGKFELLNEHSIVHVVGNFSGAFNNTSFSLNGELHARILIFQLHGRGHINDTGIGGSMQIAGLPPTGFSVSNVDGKVQVAGSIDLVWTKFATTVAISTPQQQGENQAFTINLFSAGIANLISIQLDFATRSNNPNAIGDIEVKLLNQEFIKGKAHIDGNGLRASGRTVFRIGDIFELAIELTELSIGNNFRLGGRATLSIGPIGGVEGSITVTENGVGGSFTILGEHASLHIRECHGQLLIVVNGKLGRHWIHGIRYGGPWENPPCPVSESIDFAQKEYNLPASTQLFRTVFELYCEKIPNPMALPTEKKELFNGERGNYRIKLSAQLLKGKEYELDYIVHSMNTEPSFFKELEDIIREKYNHNFKFPKETSSIQFTQYFDGSEFQNKLILKWQEHIVEEPTPSSGPTMVNFMRIVRAVRDIILK